MGSKGRLGAEPRKRSQSMFCGLASGGMEYCHAPMAVLRSSHASTMFSSPMAPDWSNWPIFSKQCALAYWLPIWKMRPLFLAAAMTRLPSSIFCTIGFSQ